MAPEDQPFADHFSGHAAAYASARPSYPEALFDAIAAAAPARRWALDVGCGNGQATVGLARCFERVVGTEPSVEQLVLADRGLRGRLVVATAEQPLVDRPLFDVVVAGQAAHWFDMERFAVATGRIARPGALVAVWCYRTLQLDQPELDARIEHFYDVTLGGWWPAGREHIDAGYRSLVFPFAEVTPPPIEMSRWWSLAQLMAYLDTWSAVRRLRTATGTDPLVDLEAQLCQLWGDTPRLVRWPLAMRWGRVA